MDWDLWGPPNDIGNIVLYKQCSLLNSNVDYFFLYYSPVAEESGFDNSQRDFYFGNGFCTWILFP